MTTKQIQERINKIAARGGDDEYAHMDEDELYLDFVKYVSTLGGTVAKKAKLVLKTREFDFARWCA